MFPLKLHFSGGVVGLAYARGYPASLSESQGQLPLALEGGRRFRRGRAEKDFMKELGVIGA